jgi:hypothetical protein
MFFYLFPSYLLLVVQNQLIQLAHGATQQWYQINIAFQAPSHSLDQISEATRASTKFVFDLIKGKQARALACFFSIEDRVNRLLVESDLDASLPIIILL